MAIVEVNGLTYRYGRVTALRGVDLAVPDGALYALLGPNGAGKTTLLQILMGLRRPHGGRATVMGVDVAALTVRDRGRVGYVAEGQSLPRWMSVGQLEKFLAPLYETWDAALARDLRERFDLDPTRRIRTLSRGERMKVALLCALAPRPRLLVMDEPFTGMDALVKDELVRGLLESAGSEGWAILLCSHDIGELELLADWVGFLERGMIRVSEPMDAMRARFKQVEVTMSSEPHADIVDGRPLPTDWMSTERSGRRLTFVASYADDEIITRAVRARFGDDARVEARGATLREVFVALAKQKAANAPLEAMA